MGRLFQYNRFGATTDNDNKKDTQLKNKMLRNAIKCPDYSDIYGHYNVDSAQEKCEQWTSKLQFPSTGEQEPNQSRTHKVYDSMKNFLQRKLFAQSSHKEQQVLDEEPTSDYDEQDLLDSSYHADAEEEEEERDADCSCSSTTTSSSNPTTPKRSPQKSLLSLNCWQTSQPSSDSNPEDDDEEVAEEDSDAGISDCCQLVTENSSLITSSKRRRIIRLPIRYGSTHHNSDDEDDEEPELLECPWYQPRITAKAAVEHLRKSTPGSFLLRRSTPRNFQLVVRLEKNSKVKAYPVQTTRNLMYRLKGAKKQFTSLKALITHHSVMQEQLPVTLDMPRERHAVKNASIRYDDDFEPLESLPLLGILKSLQAKGIEM